jgi:hypothetical protein
VLARVVQLLAGAMMLFGVWLLFVGAGPAGVEALLLGLIVLIAVRYERWRDRPRRPSSDPHWQPTGERFEDPGTGRTVEVHYNAHTGERRYKLDDDV